MSFCTDHAGQEWPTEGAKTCQVCPGPRRLNRRDASGEPVDPFPELTAAFAPQIADLATFEAHCAAREEACADAPTAAVAYARLRLSAKALRFERIEKLAEHQRVARLEERRAWSARQSSRADDEAGAN